MAKKMKKNKILTKTIKNDTFEMNGNLEKIENFEKKR